MVEAREATFCRAHFCSCWCTGWVTAGPNFVARSVNESMYGMHVHACNHAPDVVDKQVGSSAEALLRKLQPSLIGKVAFMNVGDIELGLPIPAPTAMQLQSEPAGAAGQAGVLAGSGKGGEGASGRGLLVSGRAGTARGVCGAGRAVEDDPEGW